MKFDWKLFLIVLFLGWLGIDKLYKKDVKMFVLKLISSLLIVGVVWNLYDLICVIFNRYKVNPFELDENAE